VFKECAVFFWIVPWEGNVCMQTAIMVDGGFYRQRAKLCLGNVTPEQRAYELHAYCLRHLKDKHREQLYDLYRIFYYDCPPLDKKIYHPHNKDMLDLSTTDMYRWMNRFLDALKEKRKTALRLGKLAESQAHFTIHPEVVKRLCNNQQTLESLEFSDYIMQAEQKGVDMKIGLDIASLAYKKQVEQIVLISGDSDFVSAAKLARREGIDFVLDPLHAKIKPDLFEHIDGLRTCDDQFRTPRPGACNGVNGVALF
jgi:uncharacterized LabA/DUF88 family protein